MRKAIIALFMLPALLAGVAARAQGLMGCYSTYNNVNLIGENPAYAVSDDRAQISVMGFGVLAGSNALLFNRSVLGFLATGNAVAGTDYVKDPTDNDRSMRLNMNIIGPGASFRALKKYTFAVTSDLKYQVNVSHLDNNVFMALGANGTTYPATGNNYSLNNFSMVAQMYKEVNFSYGANFMENEDMNMAGGVSLKCLIGIGAFAVGIPHASFTANGVDGTAYNVNGNINMAFTPYANKFALSNSPLNAGQNSSNNLGLGADIGVVYYLHINNTMQRKKDYQLRVAASVSDIGSINYSASSTSGSYTVANKNIDYRSIQNNPQETFGSRIFNDYLVDTVAKGTSSSSKFKVGLPTAFHLNADVNVTQETFYINGNLLLNLRTPSAGKFASYYVTTFTLTPRFIFNKATELAVGMPFSYNALGQGTCGAVFFYGPLYLGSGTLFNLLADNSIKNINLYGGFAFRIKPKHQREKSMMMM